MHRGFKQMAMAATLAATTLGAQAAQTLPTSYDMPNGDGQAHGGSYNYWDKAYNGSGDTTVDRSPLSGGLGDLQDGIIASQNWNTVENTDGTGPYVGWFDQDPTLTFHYGQTVQISSVTLYADDANGFGGVYAPTGLTINGTLHSFADPSSSVPEVFSVWGLDLRTSDLTVTIHRNRPGSWVFASEIAIAAAPVPEPTTWALTLGGLLVPLVLRARRHALG